MKIFSILILSLFSFQAYSQQDSIRIVEYEYPVGYERNPYKTYYHFEKEEGKIDIHYLKENIGLTLALPESFIDSRYKNERVVMGNKNDSLSYKWPQKTFKYDSLSRLISFSYSGCTSCSISPYHFYVIYNSKNEIIELVNRMNGFERHIIRYNKSGNITILKSYRKFYDKVIIDIEYKIKY